MGQTIISLRASHLLGADVYNAAGEKLGKIEEIVLDQATGHCAYAVLSFGGFLGFGEKLFSIPWGVFVFDQQNGRCLLNINKEKLESAPGFPKNAWPTINDRNYEQSIYDYYGKKPYWQETPRV